MNSINNFHMRYLIVVVLFAISCCTFSQKGNNKSGKNHTLQTFDIVSLRDLIGKPIKEIKIPKDYQIEDTVFEAEDGTTWPGRIISKNKESLLSIEASWQDTLTIKSISIYSPKLKIRDTIHVKSKFVEIKDFLKKDIPLGSDGYFYLKDKLDNNLHYYFDINGLSEFKNNQPKFDSIPNQLSVKLILLH